MNLLFAQLDGLDSQIIIKRLSDKHLTLSPDDLILQGMIPTSVVGALSRGFPPPLSFKVELEKIEYFKAYCSFEWQQNSLLFCGISLLPFGTMQEMMEFQNAWQYLRLITTSESGSLLKPWLAVKPKGLVSAVRNQLEFILPMHRLDFMMLWLEHLQFQVIDLNWLSGLTGDVTEEYLTHIGRLDKQRLPVLQTWLERTPATDDIDFQLLFSRSMHALKN